MVVVVVMIGSLVYRGSWGEGYIGGVGDGDIVNGLPGELDWWWRWWW